MLFCAHPPPERSASSLHLRCQACSALKLHPLRAQKIDLHTRVLLMGAKVGKDGSSPSSSGAAGKSGPSSVSQLVVKHIGQLVPGAAPGAPITPPSTASKAGTGEVDLPPKSERVGPHPSAKDMAAAAPKPAAAGEADSISLKQKVRTAAARDHACVMDLLLHAMGKQALNAKMKAQQQQAQEKLKAQRAADAAKRQREVNRAKAAEAAERARVERDKAAAAEAAAAAKKAAAEQKKKELAAANAAKKKLFQEAAQRALEATKAAAAKAAAAFAAKHAKEAAEANKMGGGGAAGKADEEFKPFAVAKPKAGAKWSAGGNK
jgi:hypothetical protein